MKNELVILDCETGGLSATENPITQVAALAIDPINLRETDRYENFVKPYGEEWIITKAALAKTQTDIRSINNGIPNKQACIDLIKFFKERNPTGKAKGRPILVGHNIGFDIDFLTVLFFLNGKKLWDYIHPVPQDTMLEIQQLEGGLLSKDESSLNNLGACCERMGIRLTNAHGAMNDVVATTELKRKLINFGRTAYKAAKTGSAELDMLDTKAPKGAKQREKFFFEM